MPPNCILSPALINQELLQELELSLKLPPGLVHLLQLVFSLPVFISQELLQELELSLKLPPGLVHLLLVFLYLSLSARSSCRSLSSP